MMAKAAMGSLLVSAMLVTSMPAQAQMPQRERLREQYRDTDRKDGDRRHDDDRIDAGTVIAGAIVIGGLAAILSSNTRDRDYRDSRGYGDEWRRYGGSHRAIERCVDAAEQRGSRFGSRPDVTRITQVMRTRGGYEIRGGIRTDTNNGRYGRNRRDGRYDRDDRYDRYDRYGRHDHFDYGQFRCSVRYGEVRNIRIIGLH
jgi:hypothetical protein